MKRPSLILLALTIGAGCGSRAASTSDSGTVVEAGSGRDVPEYDVRSPGSDTAAVTCSSLSMVGQVSLEFADTMKLGPKIAFDGDRFAVIWHSQPSVVSSLNGELRFALVDAAGKTATPDGISLGPDDGGFRASVLPSTAHPGQYVVMNRQPAGCLDLSRVDANGKSVWGVCSAGPYAGGALANHPSGGYALLLSGSSGGFSQLATFTESAGMSPATPLPTQQVLDSWWLGRTSGGFVAGWHTTNSNATLLVMDQSFKAVKETGVGHGLQIGPPSFAVLPVGFASAYSQIGSLASPVESEVYDSSGQATGHQQVAVRGDFAATTSETGLSWTGKQLVIAYSAPVSGQYSLRLLDAAGVPTGQPVAVPNCLATASGISTVWGKNEIAVATINGASGVPKSSVCVTLMGCR